MQGQITKQIHHARSSHFIMDYRKQRQQTKFLALLHNIRVYEHRLIERNSSPLAAVISATTGFLDKSNCMLHKHQLKSEMCGSGDRKASDY